ncbi:hypothetical protein D3C73_876650 [compost metagenome]
MVAGQRQAPFQAGVVVQAERCLCIGQPAFDEAGRAVTEQASAAGRAAVDVVAPRGASSDRTLPALARLQGLQVAVHPRTHTRRCRVAAIDAGCDCLEQGDGIAVALVFGIHTRQFQPRRQEVRLRGEHGLVFGGGLAVLSSHPRQRALRVVAQQRIVAGQFDVLRQEGGHRLPLLMLQREIERLAEVVDSALHAVLLAVEGDGRPLVLGLAQALLVLLLMAQLAALFEHAAQVILLGAGIIDRPCQQQDDKKEKVAHVRSG